MSLNDRVAPRLEAPLRHQEGSSVAAMEDLSLCGALAGWTDPDLEVLVELGWSVTKLATLRGCGAKILETVLISARKKKESFCQEAAALQDLIAQCDKRSANIHRADAGKGSQDLLEAHVEH